MDRQITTLVLHVLKAADYASSQVVMSSALRVP